jgi:hypothetical protein
MVSGEWCIGTEKRRVAGAFFLIFINERLKGKLLVTEDSGVWDMNHCGQLSGS